MGFFSSPPLLTRSRHFHLLPTEHESKGTLGQRPKQTALLSNPRRKPEDLAMGPPFSLHLLSLLLVQHSLRSKSGALWNIQDEDDIAEYWKIKYIFPTKKLGNKNRSSSRDIICLSLFLYDRPGLCEVGPGAPQGLPKGQFK